MNIKYKLTTLLLSIVSAVTFAQQKEFIINWQDNIELRYSKHNVVSVYGFQTKNFTYNADERSISYTDNVQLSLNNPSFKIINVQYSDISTKQLAAYDINGITEDINFKVHQTNARGKSGAYIEFNPIVKRNGRYEKVESVRVSFFQNNQRAAVSPVSFPLSNSEMSNGDWYKFYIEKDGVYKMDRSFFSSLGIDVGNVNPQNIRLFGNGGRAIPLLNSEVDAYDVD